MNGHRFAALMIYACDGDESSAVRSVDVDSDSELNTVLLAMIDELYDDSAMTDDERAEIIAELGLMVESDDDNNDEDSEKREELIDELLSIKRSDNVDLEVKLDDETKFSYERTNEFDDYAPNAVQRERDELAQLSVEELEDERQARYDGLTRSVALRYEYDGDQTAVYRHIEVSTHDALKIELAAMLNELYNNSAMTDDEYDVIARELNLDVAQKAA